MNIMLIFPPNPKSMVIVDNILAPEPLALEYIGAGVSSEHNVRIFDMRFEEDSFEKVVWEFNPDIVGFTSFTFHVNTVKRLCKQTKAMNQKIITVVGGNHATLMPQDFNEPYIDIVVIGEGVNSFKSIVKNVERGSDFSGTKGIAWQGNGQLNFTAPGAYPDLDTYPLPDRSLTEHLRQYYKMGLIVTSKGCPYHCNFCCCWKLSNRKYMRRTPELIIEELKSMQEKVVHFADDESFIDIQRMERLADLIIESGIDKKIISYVRADTVVKYPHLLEKWRRAGLTYAFIGVESHSNKYLKMYQKENDTSINEKAISILKDLGIGLMASFIIRPEFERDDFASLGEYVQKIKPEITFFSVLTPFPGTDLYLETKEQFITHNYDLFDMWHTILPTTLSLKDFYAEINKLYTATTQIGDSVFENLLTNHSASNNQNQDKASQLQHFVNVMRKVRNSYLDYQKQVSI
jgi:radical SAM superfamily enzyme YgiQ (UPF0313 family)